MCGCETWAVREQDKSRITSAEMKFVRRKTKYTWQDYKTNEDITSELKLNPVVKKFQNYLNKLIHHVQRMATLNYEMSTMWETKPRTAPQKTINGTGTGYEA